MELHAAEGNGPVAETAQPRFCFATLPTKKRNPETSRVSRGFPLMNSKKLLALSAIVFGGVVSSAFATTASSHANVAKAVAFEAPVVEKTVAPTGLSRRHEGTTVTLSMNVDDKGQPSNIRVQGNDANLTRSMVSAVSQWHFAPAKKNGVAVSSRIVLPVELTEERS
jgi:TonB family protein